MQAPIFTSFYIVHLLEWLKVFPREQILIFRNEDYTVDIKGTLTEIFRFLDVGECSSVVHTDAKHCRKDVYLKCYFHSFKYSRGNHNLSGMETIVKTNPLR